MVERLIVGRCNGKSSITASKAIPFIILELLSPAGRRRPKAHFQNKQTLPEYILTGFTLFAK